MSFVVAQTNYYTYYKLNLDYDKGAINISSLEIEFSQEKIENFFGVYTAGIMDYDNEVLNLSFFDVPNEVLWDGVNPETGEIDRGGTIELEQVSFELFIPYYENAKEIIIYDGNLDEVARKDVSMYSKEYEKITFMQALMVGLAPLFISTWLLFWSLSILFTDKFEPIIRILAGLFCLSLLIGAAPSSEDFKHIPRAFKRDPLYSLYQILLVIVSIVILWFLIMAHRIVNRK